MCEEAVDVIIELEHMGLPFSRTPDGKIAQRPSAGTRTTSGRARCAAPATRPTAPAT
jgi:succinate dehydrogenase/fumarate reductase flavoprotein subunit